MRCCIDWRTAEIGIPEHGRHEVRTSRQLNLAPVFFGFRVTFPVFCQLTQVRVWRFQNILFSCAICSKHSGQTFSCMKHFLPCVFFLLFVAAAPAQTKRTVSGYVREKGSGELLTGVSVYVPGTATGAITNTYGFYSLTLPAADSLQIAFSFVGYNSVSQSVGFQKNVELNVDLVSDNLLQEVVVTAQAQQKVSETPQMSRIDIPISQIKKIPAFLGEKDVLKVLQLMPGVLKGSEGNAGIYVRGGGPDQNLIILDDATVYNASHLFGFFSLFNGDALKSVELTKGGFPARFGGRLSSVI